MTTPPTPNAPEAQTPRKEAYAIAEAYGGCFTAFDVHGCAVSIELLIQRDLAAMSKERDELKDWKGSAMQVERSWDCQAVGKLLGLTLGSDIRAGIEPGIVALHGVIARLKEALEAARGTLNGPINWYGAEASEVEPVMQTISSALALTPEAYADRLATQDVLLAEYSKLAKERQEWALHTNDVIRALRARLTAAEGDAERLDYLLTCEPEESRRLISLQPFYAKQEIDSALATHRARKEKGT